MSKVVNLVTRSERAAASNRDALIAEAYDGCSAFGRELDFDAYAWDVSKSCPRPVGKAGRKVMLYFTTHENGTKKGIEHRTPLPEPFAATIKALIRQKKEGNPKLTDGPINRIINASRYLADQLSNRAFDPCAIVPQDVEAACDAIVDKGIEPSTQYRLGQALEEIVRRLNEAHVLAFSFVWKNRFKRVANHTRVGKRAEENRLKVISNEVLDEVARLSHLVTDDSDRLLMAGVKLLHCAPWRIGELLMLPDDPLVEEDARDDSDNLMLQQDGTPMRRVGCRYWREKDGRADIKWFGTVMAPIAREAIRTIQEITRPARKLAEWYEGHFGRAWLPGPDLGPDQHYSMQQIEEMFGLSGPGAARQWLDNRAVPRSSTVRRRDVERVLLEAWGRLEYLTSDRRKLKVSQHLFLTFANQHSYRGTNPCMLAMTKNQHFSDFLAGRGDEAEGKVMSLFEKFGSMTAEGAPMRVESHQFRHWLNDLAQRGGMSQLLVARWSGRKDASQNVEYDHMSGVELAEIGRDLMASGKVFGALADVHGGLDPVKREGFRNSVLATAHVTSLGMCDHDFTASPCPELGEEGCPGCEHLNCIKGDIVTHDRAIEVRDDTQWLLDRAIEEMNDETEGASNFVEAHRQRLAGLNRILEIHGNPEIPDGAWVRVNAESPAQYEGPPLKGFE